MLRIQMRVTLCCVSMSNQAPSGSTSCLVVKRVVLPRLRRD
jgi:hypothetical protein